MNERLQERINLYVKPKKKEKEKKNVCCSRHQDIDIVCRRHLAKLKYKKKKIDAIIIFMNACE
jgi:hypothetical protein